MLQFGHGCDAVETGIAMRAYMDWGWLQFGHGCDAVETSRFAVIKGRFPGLASIRPRL